MSEVRSQDSCWATLTVILGWNLPCICESDASAGVQIE